MAHGGLTWLRGEGDIEVSFIDATCIYLLSTYYVPDLLSAWETKMSTVRSLPS